VKNNILKLLSPKLLQSLAGEPSYSRGEEYFEEGRVTNIRIEDDLISAKVRGSYPYRIEFWEENEELNYSCSCPFYQDSEAFCKHCVATGLAVLQAEENDGVGSKEARGKFQKEMSRKDIETYLKTLDKDAIISMLLHYSDDDEELKSRLLLKAGTGTKKVHIPTFKKVIERAVDWGDFVDYKSMYQYTQGIHRAVDSLQKLLDEKQAEAVIELSEFFFKSLEGCMGMMDDSDGYMSGIFSDIQELYHEACVMAKPDPEQLARKLFDWEMHSEWEVFNGAVEYYSDLLGEKGLKTYRYLAEKEWEKFAVLHPGQDQQSYSGSRFRITSIMEKLAGQTGDVEKIVAVKKKDLSLPYHFLEIAEIYKKAGNDAKALEWAEKGVRAFPVGTDSRLREFLANEYHKRKRHDDAMKLMWSEFIDYPHFENYKVLKRHAEKSGGVKEWKLWREKAIQLLRERHKGRKHDANVSAFWNGHDRSELVKIFLWEKDIDMAWIEAQEGGCHESLWLELAAKREAQHPEDALAIYQSLVEPHVMQMHNLAYEEAAARVKKVGVLFKRLGREEEWEIYLNNLRTTHKRKRNFMALLKKIG
jgi:uncharacterized Zn finger protein